MLLSAEPSSSGSGGGVGIADRTPNHPHGHFDDFSSGHPTGVHFLFADGSVRRMGDAIDESVYRAMGTRSGGELAGDTE
jgi:prepilin-type processing-associated H-X9-DG protein